MGTGYNPSYGGNGSTSNGYRPSSLISPKTLEHASRGEYIHPENDPNRFRLYGGGHGQECIDFLEEHHIEYNINHVYPNGVRIGNVPRHKKPIKRIGNNQSWFPKNWDSKTIQEAGEYVASLKKNQNVSDGTTMWGMYKDVCVGVIKTNGKIGTIFPDSKQ